MLASCFVNSVFPTPVVPENKNDPIGLSLFLKPILDNFIAEDRTTFTPESLEELLGQREPSFEDSQKDFKILAIVLTDNSLSKEEWTKVDATVEWFSNPGDDGTYLYNFWEATRGIGTVTIQNN